VNNDRARVPVWWLIPPAVLLVLNAIAVNTAAADGTSNGVYRPSVVATGVISAALLGGYALLAVRLSHAEPRAALALNRPPELRRAAELVVVAVVAITATGLVMEPFLHGDRSQGLTPTRTPHGGEWLTLLAALLALGRFVPLCEELLFRGLGFAAIDRFAVPITATAFAIAHGLPELLPPVFVAGLVLGALRRRTGSLWPGVTAHATVNLIGILAAVLTAT
jgi:membrane protease YdiL (CAAX protease family)